MKRFLTERGHSFKYAFSGCWFVICTQPNAWLHLLVTVAVILLGCWLRLPVRDWALIVLTMGLVWAAEFFNTAIETLVNLVSPQQNPLAKIAKDVSAAAVLLAACAAVILGVLILGPPLWERLQPVFFPAG